MAESRWPDVVPARKEVGEQHLQHSSSDPSSSSEGGGGSGSGVCPTAWHISILASQNNPSDPPVVQIWTHSSSDGPSSPTDSPLPPNDDDLEDAGKQTRRCSNHSGYSAYSGDSGIDSQLSSPTVTDLGSGRIHGRQAFVLDLSATHLAVPSKLKSSLCTGNNAIFDYDASNSSVETVVTIENHNVDDVDRSHPSESTDASSHSSASQKRVQDLEPLQFTERPDSPVRHQQLSPKVNIIRFPKRRSVGSFDSCIRHDGSIGSTESNGSNGLMNVDQETDPGSVSYSSSRQMSISSELERRASGSAAGKPPLLRSSSSRSAFLSVPVRIVPNCQQQQQQQQQHHRRRPSFQLGSSSSLMMVSRSSSQSKTPSPTMSQYMRLAADGGLIDDIMMASMTSTDLASINGSDRLYPVDGREDDRYYNARATATAAAAAASLSLTQRLAFPELVSHFDGDVESTSAPKTSRQERYTMPREEGSLNFFAKIITFLVLVFVIVLVVGVLVKISHTPR